MLALTEQDLDQLLTWGERDPLRFYRPTLSGLAMLADTSRYVLMRGPNQAGKTWTLAADLLDCLLGLGRWNPKRPRKHRVPVKVWVLCASHKNAKDVADKIMELAPAGSLHPDTTMGTRGFTAGLLRMANGSEAWFKTVNQNRSGQGKGLETATLDGVFVDEPPPEHVWSPLVARVNQRRGFIRVYMCPQDGTGNWLRPLVESGQLAEHTYGLTVANCWPIGAFRPFKDQDQIDDFKANVRPSQYAQRIEGAWEGQPDEAYFPDFDTRAHVIPTPLAGKGWRVAVGVDYGPAIGKPAVALVAVRNGQAMEPTVQFLDSERCPPTERWGDLEIARAIKSMLDRHSLRLEDIDAWTGDRPATDRQGSRQSNARTWAALLQLYGRPPSRSPFKVPRKWQGCVQTVCEQLNALFVRGRAHVVARAIALIQFFELFDGDVNHSTKDVGDAARYAFQALVKPRWYGGPGQERPNA